MTSKADLKYQDSVTTGEALEVLNATINHYLSVLGRVIAIKIAHPVTDESKTFIRRGQTSETANTEVLLEIKKILLELQQKNDVIEDQLLQEIERGLEHQNNPNLNEQLLANLDQAIQDCQKLLQNKARRFTDVLNELESLRNLFSQKLVMKSEQDKLSRITGRLHRNKSDQTDESLANIVVEHDEKLVFVRVFHRELIDFGIKKSANSIIKPLLESIKFAEKHGLAIYADEDLAKRSLKGERYGYVTVCIKKIQDVTADRSEKIDPNLNCQLLAVTNVELNELRKFHHRNIDYPIIDGVIKGI